MTNLIRVLHVVTKMDAAGIETLLMTFYRQMDRSKVQFDFLVHRNSEGFYDNEILKMGEGFILFLLCILFIIVNI